MNWIRLPIVVALKSILEIYSPWQGRSFPRDLAFLRELWLFSAHVTHTHTREAKFFGDPRTGVLYILSRQKFDERSTRDK